MSWVTIAVTVVSAAASMAEQQHVAKKQDKQLAEQLRQQGESERKVNARTQEFIQGQDANAQPQETAARKSYDAALDANQHQAAAPLATAGNVSDAYKKAGSDAALGISDYGHARAGLQAAIGAPTQQRIDNQRKINDFGIDVGQINRGQKSQDYLDTMKLNSIHANPYVSLLAGIGSAYARAKMGSGGYTGGSTDLSGNQVLGGIDLSAPQG